MENIENSDPMSENLVPFEGLRLTIQGLAFVYEKGGFAKLRCPIAADHKLKLIISSGALGGTPGVNLFDSEIIIPKGAVVEITNTNFQNPAVSSFENIFNFAELHRGHPVKFVNNIIDVAKFQINGASLRASSDAIFKDSFQTWEIRNHGSQTESRQREDDKIDIVSVITGSVMFVDRRSAQTVITIMTPSSRTDIRLNYDGGETHSITISNLCNEVDNACKEKSDFLHYYPLLNHSALGKKYDFIKLPKAGNRAPCNVAYSSDDPE